MTIQIDNNKTLAQIQEEFHQHFSHLKIQFFSKPHGAGEGSPKDDMLNPNKTIGEIRTNQHTGEISFNKDSSVAELESTFQQKFGVSAQVFRKSGSIWLETSKTDSWTLEKQNNTGKESDTQYNINTQNYARKD